MVFLAYKWNYVIFFSGSLLLLELSVNFLSWPTRLFTILFPHSSPVHRCVFLLTCALVRLTYPQWPWSQCTCSSLSLEHISLFGFLANSCYSTSFFGDTDLCLDVASSTKTLVPSGKPTLVSPTRVKCLLSALKIPCAQSYSTSIILG